MAWFGSSAPKAGAMEPQGSGLTRAQKMQMFGATLRDVGAGLGGGQGGAIAATQSAFEAAREKAMAVQARQAMLEQGKALGLGPQELFALQHAPDDTLKAIAERFKPIQVSGGNTGFNMPGQGPGPFIAPKLVENDGVYGLQGAAGYTQQGQRGETHAEVQTKFKNAADIDAEIKRLQYMKGELGVRQGQLGINRAAYEARLRGVGGFGTPGVGSMDLGSGETPIGPGWE